jgi:hypothetical protein
MASEARVPALAALGPAAGAAIGRHMDAAFHALVRDGHCAEGPRFLRLLTGEPHPLGNFAVVSAPVDLDATRAVVEPLVAASTPAAVFFPDLDVPASVHAYLTEQEFSPHSVPAMGVDIANLTLTSLPDGYELVRVGARDEGEEWVQQFAVGYEVPLGVARCFLPAVQQAAASESALQFFGIRRNGTIVCTSACYLDGGLAGIYCVATIPEERRKGLGAHATAEPLRHAARMGYRVGVLQSSEAGHDVYKSLGFADLGGVPLYVRIAG